MSLIICRNRPNEQVVVGEHSSIYEPYSFRNQLTSNIEVPANAQIALQSVKCNMDGSVILGDDAKIFYIYWGPKVVGVGRRTPADGFVETIEDSPFANIQVSLFPDRTRDGLEKLSIEDVTQELERVVNMKMTNPNLKNRLVATTVLNANGSLQGFRFEAFESISGGTADFAPTSTIPPAYVYAAGNKKGMIEGRRTPMRIYQFTNGATGSEPDWTYEVLGAPFNFGKMDITTNSPLSRVAIGNVPPLNLKGGEAKYGILGCIGVHHCRFLVGLSRGSRGIDEEGGISQSCDKPNWFVVANGSVARSWIPFHDFAVMYDPNAGAGDYQGRLVVSHTVVNTDDLGGIASRNSMNHGKLKIQRLQYGDGTGTLPNTGTSADIVASAGWSDDYGYDLANNPLSIEYVRFFAEGSQIGIKLESTAASGSNVYDLIVYSNLYSQKSLLKPVNHNCESLYPLLCMNNGGSGGAAHELSIHKFDGNNASCPNNDFLSDDERHNGFYDRTYGSDQSTTQVSQQLDMNREYNNYTPSVIGNLVSPLRPYPGMGADPFPFTDIVHRWSVLPNEVYGGYQSMYVSKANMSHLLGFPNMPTINAWAADADGDQFVVSFTPPDVLPSRSIFVRLENFGNESINAFQGLKSKIIAHLPRFDGTNSVGPLYLEPNNLVYVDLKNPAPLKINSFDISLCYADETYATALQGTTIVCLHLREKP